MQRELPLSGKVCSFSGAALVTRQRLAKVWKDGLSNLWHWDEGWSRVNNMGILGMSWMSWYIILYLYIYIYIYSCKYIYYIQEKRGTP